MLRSIVGALLFFVYVGEMTVGSGSGLYSLPGIIVFSLLYFSYFLLLDSLVERYKLNNLQVVLVNFALYAVLITGLLHGELQDYTLHPENNLITTLIRIQCSLYPLFAFYVLRFIAPQRRLKISVKKAVLLFIAFILLMTPTKTFGLYTLFETFHTVPGIAVFFSLIAVILLIKVLGVPQKLPTNVFKSKAFGVWCIVLFVLGLIPTLTTFLILLVLMIILSLYYLLKSTYRNSSVAPTKLS
ncbi:MAG: hypothetical protein ACOH18_02640 [Candidatus Saccharimonadaceae bacterium]